MVTPLDPPPTNPLDADGNGTVTPSELVAFLRNRWIWALAIAATMRTLLAQLGVIGTVGAPPPVVDTCSVTSPADPPGEVEAPLASAAADTDAGVTPDTDTPEAE